MFLRVSPEKCRKIKALLLLAIVSASEGRRVRSHARAGNHFASGGSARHADSVALGRYDAADSGFQAHRGLFADARDALLTDPKLQELASSAQEHLTAIMEDPGLREQLNLLEEQIEALAKEPKVQEWHSFVTEAMEKIPGNPHLQERAKLALEHLSAIMSDARLLQQAELLLSELELLAYPRSKSQDLQKHAEVFEKHMMAIMETPELQTHSTLFAEHLKAIMEHPEVRAMQGRAKLASDKLRAITEDQDLVERVELASEQWKAVMGHSVLRERSKLFAQQVNALVTDWGLPERASAAFSLAEVNRSSSGVSFTPSRLARHVIRAPAPETTDPQMAASKRRNVRRGSSRKPQGASFPPLIGAQLFDEVGVLPPIGRWDPLKIREQGPERYRRFVEMEIKHGRLAMAAFLGAIVTYSGIRFPGYLSLLQFPQLPFADVPGGPIASWAAVPQLGWFQIVGFISLLEVSLFKQDPLKEAGDVVPENIPWVRYEDEDVRRFKLNVERNNGRAAMMGITGMIIHEALTGNPVFPIGGYE